MTRYATSVSPADVADRNAPHLAWAEFSPLNHPGPLKTSQEVAEGPIADRDWATAFIPTGESHENSRNQL